MLLHDHYYIIKSDIFFLKDQSRVTSDRDIQIKWHSTQKREINYIQLTGLKFILLINTSKYEGLVHTKRQLTPMTTACDVRDCIASSKL
jgi:hypothetical protein